MRDNGWARTVDKEFAVSNSVSCVGPRSNSWLKAVYLRRPRLLTQVADHRSSPAVGTRVHPSGTQRAAGAEGLACKRGCGAGPAHMEPDSAPLMAIETEVSPSTAKVHTVGQAAMRHRRPMTQEYSRATHLSRVVINHPSPVLVRVSTATLLTHTMRSTWPTSYSLVSRKGRVDLATRGTVTHH